MVAEPFSSVEQKCSIARIVGEVQAAAATEHTIAGNWLKKCCEANIVHDKRI